MMETLKVYSYRRCPFAIRVRMTLHEKQIPFEVIEEDLKNMSEELRKMHPEARVPVLVHGETIVYESAIITEYLDEAFPEKSLMPSDAKEKVEVRLWTYWCNHLFKPDIDRLKYGETKLTQDEMDAAKERMKSHLSKLEQALSEQEWLVGTNFSLADIHVFPFVRQFSKVENHGSQLQNYPATNQWLESILARPTFEETMKKI